MGVGGGAEVPSWSPLSLAVDGRLSGSGSDSAEETSSSSHESATFFFGFVFGGTFGVSADGLRVSLETFEVISDVEDMVFVLSI